MTLRGTALSSRAARWICARRRGGSTAGGTCVERCRTRVQVHLRARRAGCCRSVGFVTAGSGSPQRSTTEFGGASSITALDACSPNLDPCADSMDGDKKTLITGGTGFVGQRLRSALVASGNSVSIATRAPEKHRDASAMVEYVPWLPDLAKFDAVVNLAGEPIMGKRWSEKFKAKILSSRVEGTRKLVDAIAAAEKKPSVLVSASAIGFYGEQGERALTESSAHGDDFMAMVCEQWEREAQRAAQFGVRVVSLRIGVVLGREGGALAKMLPPFELGLGGPFGSGAMYMSWIHVQDLVELVQFAIRSQ